jgi:hypothetical protein
MSAYTDTPELRLQRLAYAAFLDPAFDPDRFTTPKRGARVRTPASLGM